MGNLWVPISICFPHVKLPVKNLWVHRFSIHGPLMAHVSIVLISTTAAIAASGAATAAAAAATTTTTTTTTIPPPPTTTTANKIKTECHKNMYV